MDSQIIFVPVFANENRLSESETSLLLVLFSLTGIFSKYGDNQLDIQKYKGTHSTCP